MDLADNNDNLESLPDMSSGNRADASNDFDYEDVAKASDNDEFDM